MLTTARVNQNSQIQNQQQPSVFDRLQAALAQQAQPQQQAMLGMRQQAPQLGVNPQQELQKKQATYNSGLPQSSPF